MSEIIVQIDGKEVKATEGMTVLEAAQSAGIQKNMETFDVTVDNSDQLKRYYDDQDPYYRKMHAQRLQPETPV